VQFSFSTWEVLSQSISTRTRSESLWASRALQPYDDALFLLLSVTPSLSRCLIYLPVANSLVGRGQAGETGSRNFGRIGAAALFESARLLRISWLGESPLFSWRDSYTQVRVWLSIVARARASCPGTDRAFVRPRGPTCCGYSEPSAFGGAIARFLLLMYVLQLTDFCVTSLI